MIDLDVLRSTLELTLARDDSFPARFYELLFERFPEVRPLFHRSSPGAQQKMFALKLSALVDHLDDPTWTDRELASLARSHAGYGVTEDMYVWVGETLVATLREACGDDWSDRAEAAWREAYATMVRAILANLTKPD